MIIIFFKALWVQSLVVLFVLRPESYKGTQRSCLVVVKSLKPEAYSPWICIGCAAMLGMWQLEGISEMYFQYDFRSLSSVAASQH